MTRAALLFGFGFASVGLTACALDTGVRSVELELNVAGTDVGSDFEGRDGARITLTRADLAFGPLYLCRGQQAGELCETAALEWTDAIVVDALDPQPLAAGTLLGSEGRVRSFMYDLGLHSLLSEATPFELPAARELDGNSVVLEGQAELDGRSLPFRFEVAVAQTPETTQGVPVVVSSQQSTFDEYVDGNTESLTVTFDPRGWLRSVRFADFVDDRACDDAEAPEHVCDGDLWQTCDGAGGVADTRDCAESDRVCVVDEGCRAAFEAPEGSQAWLSVRNGLIAGARPAFRWSRAD